MDTLQLVLQVATIVALGIGGLLFRKYLPKYVEKKAENLATKEDVAEITKLTEQARLPFLETLERMRGELQRQSATLTRRQELYVEFAEAATSVFLSGRAATDDDKRRFLASYSAAFLYAPDAVLQAINAHLDLQMAHAAAPQDAKDQLQVLLRASLAAMLLALRREAFHADSEFDIEGFRFVSFASPQPLAEPLSTDPTP
jgi:hypothetical protein